MNAKEKRVAKVFKWLTNKMNFKNYSSQDMPAQVKGFTKDPWKWKRKLKKDL